MSLAFAVSTELNLIQKRIRRHLHLDYYYPNMTEEERKIEDIHVGKWDLSSFPLFLLLSALRSLLRVLEGSGNVSRRSSISHLCVGRWRTQVQTEYWSHVHRLGKPCELGEVSEGRSVRPGDLVKSRMKGYYLTGCGSLKGQCRSRPSAASARQ